MKRKKREPAFKNYWGEDPTNLLEYEACDYQEYIATWLLLEGGYKFSKSKLKKKKEDQLKPVLNVERKCML